MKHMEHSLFKPKRFEDGQHQVVGDCNGIPMADRWKYETPLQAKAILKHAQPHVRILDYGCGVGRLAKEVLKQDTNEVFVDGTDDSYDMLLQASGYVDHTRFRAVSPHKLEGQYAVIYCIYVLQHVPAIELREVLARIHYHLSDGGVFIYQSSDYRMALRFDKPGFFDDRFLGVDIRAEIGRYFNVMEPMYSRADRGHSNIMSDGRDILSIMVDGAADGLAHPAFVYTKKLATLPYFNFNCELEKKPQTEPTHNNLLSDKEAPEVKPKGPQKLLLLNRLSPGDILVMTNAIRDLHKAHPGKYFTDVRSPCSDIFLNNPYVTKLEYSETQYNIINNHFAEQGRANPDEAGLDPSKHIERIDDVLVIDMHYPMVHQSGLVGSHFAEGHRAFLEKVLEVKIPQTDLRPEIYLTLAEQEWVNPLTVKKGFEDRYWILNAGAKADYSLKQWPFFETLVADFNEAFENTDIKMVQIGQRGHQHGGIEGAVDFIGQTNVREFFRLVYQAEGLITCVSFPMHVAAALNKPCVVIAGAREPTRWELYPNHQFIYVNGCLPCGAYDGCWRSTIEECNNKVGGVPKCMTLIRPQDVLWAIQRYYRGGILEEVKAEVSV